MRKQYDELSIKILNFEEADVITSSGDVPTGEQWRDGGDFGKDWQW